MKNPIFFDDENIPLVIQNDEDDYDDYNTPNTTWANKTTFKISNTKDKETKSTLLQRQKIKRNKAAALPYHLNIADNLDLINYDHFKLTADSKKGAPAFEFLNDDKRDPLTKQTSKLYGPNSLKCIFGGVNILNNFLDIDKWKIYHLLNFSL